MGIITKIGLWIDRRFPEKVSAEEAKQLFESQALLLGLVKEKSELNEETISKLLDRVNKLEIDMEKIKSSMIVKSRSPNMYSGNMNPNLPPVMPVK